MESSWQLLSPELQQFFSRLSLFRGGWTLEAAEAVCGEPLAADYLAQLRETSLIVAEVRTPEMRFSMLETVREFAAEQLAANDREATAEQHAEYYLALAEEGDAHLTGPRQVEWLGRLDPEVENFRAAVAWGLDARPLTALRLARTLAHYWQTRGHWQEAREALEQALLRTPNAPPTLRAGALAQAGWLMYVQGDCVAARDTLERGLELSRRVGDDEHTQMALYALAHVAYGLDRLEDRPTLFGESLAIARNRGDQRGIARALHGLGDVAMATQDYAVARGFYRESLDITRQVGSKRAVANGLAALAKLEDAQGNLSASLSLFEEAHELYQEVGDKQCSGTNAAALGHVAWRRGDTTVAREHFEEALTLMRELGSRRVIANALHSLGCLEAQQGNHQKARAYLTECLEIRGDGGNIQEIYPVLEERARAAAEEGDAAAAVKDHAAAAALRERLHLSGPPHRASDDGAFLSALRSTLGEDAYKAAWQEGWDSAGRYR